jgi:ornithine carbamoyltransferase
MWELKGRISKLKVAFIGDGNNVAHSLIFAGAQLGADVWIATPLGFEPKADAIIWASQRSRETGASCTITSDPWQAVADADVVYTDAWASMGQELEADKRRQIFRPFQVNRKLFGTAKKDAIFMHCLPAHRGEEVTDDVIDDPRSVVFQEAENRLHVQKAIMVELMKDETVEIPALQDAGVVKTALGARR